MKNASRFVSGCDSVISASWLGVRRLTGKSITRVEEKLCLRLGFDFAQGVNR
jgi:hypothetical protein